MTATLPASIADVPAYIEHAIAEEGERAWFEVEWLYRHAAPADVHAFVNEAAHHLAMRDLWLDDPRNAADIAHEVITADLFAYGEHQAAREEQQLRDLIAAWVRSHELTAVSR